MTLNKKAKLALMSTACFGILLPTVAFSQTDGAAEEAAERNDQPGDEIIVTGTSREKSTLRAAFSTSVIDGDRLETFETNSLADVLRHVPGVKAEGGGGEAGTNVFIRGLPQGGQIQFTPLYYDGMPVLSTFGLNASSYDVFHRNDLGVESLEFVRGGISNLFGAGSVAGVINVLTKSGGDEHEGVLQAEWANRGRLKTDFAVSGPLGSGDSGLYYALSGFYRADDGPIDTGFDSDGYQIKGNIKKEFGDGSGSITLYGQFIDDSTQFLLPLPLDGVTRERTTGNDGNIVTTVQTSEARNLSFQTPDGIFNTGIEDGIRVDGGMFGIGFEKDLGDGWAVNGRAKFAKYDHEFNLFLNGDGVINAPEGLQEFLDNRSLGDLSDASFTFATSGLAVPDDFLLFGNRILDLNRDVEDFTAEVNFTKSMVTGGLDHLFTFGGYYARAEGDDDAVTTRFLGDFNNRSRLVNLVITDPVTMTDTIVSQNGLLAAGIGYQDRDQVARRFAGYFADEIEAGNLNVEFGVRIEKFIGDVFQERTDTIDLAGFGVNAGMNLTPDLSEIVFGTGAFDEGTVSDTEWAVAGGLQYSLDDHLSIGGLSVYANFSRGFFFPQLRSQRFSSLGEFGQFEAEIIKTAEAGVKYSGPRFATTVAGFWTDLENRADVRFLNAPGGGVQEVVQLLSSRAYGLEANLSVNITDTLSFDGNITLQDHEFTEGSDPSLVGRELRRQPGVLANTGLYYDDGRFDFAVMHSFNGENFANNVNTVTLDAFNILNLDAGYSLPIGDDTLRIGFGVFNLLDSQGLTEGNPRAGAAQSATGDFFVGRPILPRRFTVKAAYKF